MAQIVQAIKTQPADPFAAERHAFERQRAKLLRRFPGQFVAFYQGRIVGHDQDDEALAARLFAELGDAPFYASSAESVG
jgi:hypothetical protein